MEKSLKKQLNTLKGIKPEKNWVVETRRSLLGNTSGLFDIELQPKVSFGSLALAGLSVFIFLFGFSGIFSDLPMNPNMVTPTVQRIVMEMQNETTTETPKNDTEEVMTATADVTDRTLLLTQVDIEDLSVEEQRQLIRKSTEDLLAEINELEERVLKVMGSNR